jgi:hypothetical protein
MLRPIAVDTHFRDAYDQGHICSEQWFALWVQTKSLRSRPTKFQPLVSEFQTLVQRETFWFGTPKQMLRPAAPIIMKRAKKHTGLRVAQAA